MLVVVLPPDATYVCLYLLEIRFVPMPSIVSLTQIMG